MDTRTHRSAWRITSSIEQKSSEGKLKLTQEYRQKIEEELQDICKEVLVCTPVGIDMGGGLKHDGHTNIGCMHTQISRYA